MVAAPRYDVPETLFDEDTDLGPPDEPTTGVRRRSPAYEAMRAEVHARQDRRRAKPKTIAASKFDRSRAEVQEMMRSGEWTGVSASHLVALYDVMHDEVYGVACDELGPEARYNATMLAAQLTKRAFDGNYEAAMEFMRWAWTREARREKWRRENGRTDGQRVGYRLMFGGSMVTDYKLFLHRSRHK